MNRVVTEHKRDLTEFLLKIPVVRGNETITELFVIQPPFAFRYETDDYCFAAWGDPIVRNSLPDRFQGIGAARCITENISGHFYYILLRKNSGELILGNSAFGILPVYYCDRGDSLLVSDNALTLGKYIGEGKVSGRFILETVLFNYPLFDSSILEGIKLLGANFHLSVIHGKWSADRHLAVEDLFESSPSPWREAVGKTAEAFIESVSAYLPDERYASALTGGFDGRTLVAAGLGSGRAMMAFSFGSEASDDVRIASEVASAAEIPFRQILLGPEYVRNDSYDCGRDFIINASGTATFARAHYLFAARDLAMDFNYMVTGNFGSEIFRSPHSAGAVLSPNTLALFTAGTVERALEKIEKSAEFRSLNMDELQDEWDSIKSDFHLLPCFKAEYAMLTPNQRFYIFIFEEVFRKYFGAEMANQFRYIRNRTPFLDLGFLKTIFASRLAGVHSDFFEHNPVKRFKGQVLYAHIIRKAFPPLGKIMTDKGYRPDDLLTLSGKAAITANYIRKRSVRQFTNGDPYAVKASWEHNRNRWRGIPVPEGFFVISSDMNAGDTMKRDLLFRILSLSVAVKECSGEDANRLKND